MTTLNYTLSKASFNNAENKWGFPQKTLAFVGEKFFKMLI